MQRTFAAIIMSLTTAQSAVFAQETNPAATTPVVKYPAALIIEGGEYVGIFEKNNVSWRIYLCLKQTTEPTSGQVVLDFRKLGNPIESSSERLNQVVLNYKYTAALTTDSTGDVSYGSAKFESQSQQSWNWIDQSPEYSAIAHDPRADLGFFNLASDGALIDVRYHIYNPHHESSSHYVSTTLDRVGINTIDGRKHVIEACEQADQPIVVQKGDEIRGLD